MKDLYFISRLSPAGTPLPAPHLFYLAWDECIELQVMDRESWVNNTLSWLHSIDRYDIGLHNGQEVIGGLCLSECDDAHVGTCLSVAINYVDPKYRSGIVGARCFRECMRIARASKYNILAYTHRIGDWRYETIYRRLHGKEGQGGEESSASPSGGR